MTKIANIDINLNIESWNNDLSSMKHKDAVSKMNYNVLYSWFKRKNLHILEKGIFYKPKLLNILCSVFSCLKGAQSFEKYEDEVFFVLKKSI